MSAYIVVEIDIADPVRYEEYKRLAPPSIAQYGGRYLARGAETTILEGTWQPSRLVILEFPTADQARAWWGSPEYAAAKALRRQISTTDMVLIPGVG